MALDVTGAATCLLNRLLIAGWNAKIKHDQVKGMLYCLVGKELDDHVKELFGSLLVDWNDELYNKLRIYSLSLPKLVKIQFTGRIAFVGASTAGKTTIVQRLTNPAVKIPDLDLTSEEPNKEQIGDLTYFPTDSTKGEDVQWMTSKEFVLDLWDTSGHKSYEEYIRSRITRMDFVIIVSDATEPDETNIEYWVKAAEECDKHWIHVANKYDAVKRRDPYKDHRHKPHFCVSGLTGQGLSELRDFIVLAEFLQITNETELCR